jgi:hypothetical protein
VQTTSPENGKGRRVTSAATQMQTCNDFAEPRPHQQGQIDNPRHRRALLALLKHQQGRKDIDRVTGSSNGPDEVMRIRRRYGLSIPCPRVTGVDMDGHPVQTGVYHLTSADQAKVKRLLGIAK